MDIEFKIECNECGEELTITESSVGPWWKDKIIIKVKPCERCLEKVREEGEEERI